MHAAIRTEVRIGEPGVIDPDADGDEEAIVSIGSGMS